MKKTPTRITKAFSDHVNVEEVYNVLKEGVDSGFCYTLEFDGYQYPVRDLKMLDEIKNWKE